VGIWISEDPIGFEAKDMNLYRYILNNVIISTDPDGKDIYLKKGNVGAGPVNNLIHQNVCVDTWNGSTKTGIACFSFGVDAEDQKLKWFNAQQYWLGWYMFPIIPPGCGFWGEIYQAADTGIIVFTKTTTSLQDITWRNYMMGRVGTRDRYTLLWLNCVHYTNNEFSDAP
jgi:hypothetical protein